MDKPINKNLAPAMEMSDIRNKHERQKYETIKSNEKELQKIKDDYKKKATETRKQNEAAINHIKYSNVESSKKLRQQQEIESLKQKQIYNQKLLQTKNKNQKNIEQIQKQFSEQETRLKNGLSKQRELHSQEYIHQQKEFEQNYGHFDKQNSKSLSEQKKNLDFALRQAKRESLSTVESYQKKAFDPFYKITSPNKQLTDQGSHYLLKVFVPEEFKHEITVSAQTKNIIISGKREFEGQKEQDGSQLSTHKYMSFREDLPVEQHIDKKSISRQYNVDEQAWIYKLRKS